MNNTQTTNTTGTKNNWTEVKSKIKAKFAKLTDDSIETAKDNLDLLQSKIEHAYSYSREQAHKELTRFKETLKSESGNKAEEKPVLKTVPSEPVAEISPAPAAAKVG